MLNVIYLCLGGWAVFSGYYIWKLSQKGPSHVNLYIYDSIPTVFTTLGVLGTFLGIFFGLQDFDVDNITESIPDLLEGLKTAFLTSIAGIILSLVFGRLSHYVLKIAEDKAPPKPTSELAALQEMVAVLKTSQEQQNNRLDKLHQALVGQQDDSVATQLVRLRNGMRDNEQEVKKQGAHLQKIEMAALEQTGATQGILKALGGDQDTSMLSQMERLRDDLNQHAKATQDNIEIILAAMESNSDLLSKKFDEFSELLAKNNTEALVKVMKQATEEFNKQMSALVEKLVQENFKELNNSVQRLNDWQMENKEMIIRLTNQFKQVSEDFSISSATLKEVSENTHQLTDDNSHLRRLIEELQKVMIEDTKYQELIGKLNSTVNTLEGTTDSFDETTQKLNNWVRKQMSFSDSVSQLLTRLEEIDRIKDINEVFWKNTERQLNDGVQLVANASRQLSSDIDSINDEFYKRLNDTLQNLDNLIQRIIINYN